MGVQAQSITWPPNMSELKGKRIISLLELENSMLADISPDDFNTLKKLVLQSSRLLWVSMGDEPVMSAAIGYLRALQNENMNLRLRYLLVEDRVGRAVGNMITKVAMAQGNEREYAELDGYLCINRWVADNGMSQITGNDEETGTPEYMALGESRTALKIVTWDPEQPESFCFTIDTDADGDLKADELEIEVKALGLK